jgi:acetyltransferase-like isoleucine patch superfamily enzyme
MIQSIITRGLKIVGIDPGERFKEGWTGQPLLRALLQFGAGFLRGTWYRMFFRTSSGMLLAGRGVTIRYANFIQAGRNFIIEDEAEINGLSKRGLTFGNKVTIGKYAMIRPTNFYGGELGEGLKVGDNSNIGPYCYIGCSGYIEIGSNVMMSPRVGLYAENHNFERHDIPMKQQGVKRRTIVIEDDCWIAANSIIVAGVTIGKGSVVAAGSVVTSDIPPYSVAAGVPAKVIKQRMRVRKRKK